MRYFFTVFTALIFFVQPAFCIEQVNVHMNIDFDYTSVCIKKKFQSILTGKENKIIYSEVPRGLILSIAEDKLFTENSSRLTLEGEELLKSIAEVLREFNNNCAIESHTDEEIHSRCSSFKEAWEISIPRANAVAAYLIKNCSIDPARLYPIGYGSIMPFKENVALKDFTDNRVDFVIFDYSSKR